jgi:predicted DNA-binding transcriptional regulator AlpA
MALKKESGTQDFPALNCSGSPVSGEDPIEILTPQQLAERLQVKPSWVYEQTRNRSGVRNPDPLPHIKMGLYLRFDWRDVLAWLERQKQHSDHHRTTSLRSTARAH